MKLKKKNENSANLQNLLNLRKNKKIHGNSHHDKCSTLVMIAFSENDSI